MKVHTNDYKNNLTKYGKMINSKITYILDGETIELGKRELNSVAPHYKGDILKSVMKQLDIDSNIYIDKDTVLNYQFGLKVNGQYEYVNYGNYIVYSVEKQEGERSYLIKCYDKMLYAMKDYENSGITYPITVRNYINTICNKLGLTFANNNDTFVNYDKVIPGELYLDNNGKSLGYTFRDVLDELAEVTASTICINEETDELEIRYINDTNETIDEKFLKPENVKFGKKFGPINTIILSRSGGADKITLSIPEDLSDNEKNAIEISDNQIMNDNNRADFMFQILNKIYGLEYYFHNYSTKGITYLNLCDKYNVKVFNNVYPCIMFNDEVNITKGLSEDTFKEMEKEIDADYKYTSSDDRKINQVYIIAKKNEGEIEAVVSSVNEVKSIENNNYQELLKKIQPLEQNLIDISDIRTTVTQLQTDTYTKTEVQKIVNGTGVDGTKVTAVISNSGTFDENGMTYERTGAKTSTTINEVGVNVKDSSGNSVQFSGYVNEENTDYSDYVGQTIVGSENIIVKKYLNIGNHSRIQDYGNGTGIFYRGGF